MRIRRVWSLLFVLLMVLSTFLSTSKISLAAAMEGEGTEKSPYLIRTVKDLQSISEYPSAHYKLMNDLDLTLNYVDWKPIEEFKGVLDGNNKVLEYLEMMSFTFEDNIGLFRKLENATIKNLGFADSVVLKILNNNVGLLAGIINNSTILNCTVNNVIIRGINHVGGLVGKAINGSKIINTKVINSEISGSKEVGGLVGTSDASNYFNCHVIDGNIENYDAVTGGLVGKFINGSAIKCSSSADIESDAYIAGGLIGLISESADLKQCYAVNNVVGADFVGGLIGYSSHALTKVEDSYSIGTVQAGDLKMHRARGLIGHISGDPDSDLDIKRCFHSGEIIGKRISGLISYGKIENSYYDADTTKIKYPDKKEARTTEQMHQKSNYEGWDFENIWYIDEGKDYPKLKFTLTDPELVPLEKLELQQENVELLVGESLTIVPIFTPVNATNKNLTWISTDPSVVSVDDNGVANAAALGSSSIKAISEDGNHVAFCNIIVKQDETPDNIALGGVASSNSSYNEDYDAKNAIDGDASTKWLAAESDNGIYLQIDFKEPKTIQKIKLKEMDNIIDEFALQIWKNSKWVDIYTGNAIGKAFEYNFEPVTTDKVRLMLYTYLNGACPSIHEFEIYR